MKYKLLNKILAITMLVVFLFPAGTALADKGGGQGPGTESFNGVYIVQMAGAPVVAYEGDVEGYRATKPNKNQKIDPNDGDVQNYAAYLNGKHDEALGKVGGGQKLYDYV